MTRTASDPCVGPTQSTLMNPSRSIASLLNPVRAHVGPDDVFEGSLFAPIRSPFQTDSDKITFSEGFRALADKTQVHDRTYAGGAFRNRLTHSMEVGCVGRSLGVGVGARMLNLLALHAPANGDAVWRVDPDNLGHIVAAACMAHDIGNPPFGHDGEDTIAAFFTDADSGREACKRAGTTVARELRQHEGNAQGFRMITRSMGWRGEVGLNLTAATLAAFGKYPHAIRSGTKKYGVHAADLPTMERVASSTGMLADGKGGWIRHPLAWLMEAADDICYLTVDLEDAAHLGIVSFDVVLDLFAPIVGPAVIDAARRIEDRGGALQFLRSQVVKGLIASCVEVYASVAGAIENGTLGKNAYGSGLVAHGRHGAAIANIRRFSKAEIYESKIVQDSRQRYRLAMHTALDRLTQDMLGWLDTRRPDERLTADDTESTTLARLPKAVLGVRIPSDPAQAFPWLLDQVTLLSDADVLRLADAS